MILVDSSVWIEHFKKKERRLIPLLEAGQVLMHPMVVQELACGTPPQPRAGVLRMLEDLEPLKAVSYREFMHFLELHGLYGRGCGLVDVALLAATTMTPGTRLWTFDARLARLADELGLLFQPAMH